MENYKIKKGRNIMKRGFYILLFFFISGGLLCYSNQANAGGLPEDDKPAQKANNEDVSALLEEIKKVKQKLSEFDELKDKISKLEKRVILQDKIISGQKKVLEEIVETSAAKKKASVIEQRKVLINKFIINGAEIFDSCKST